MDCPSRKDCLFYCAHIDSDSDTVRKLIRNYAYTENAWKECIRLYIQNRHGITLPYDFGPHGKTVD